MLCPHCKTATLVMSERQGIEIDYCPECRGVWLDRGELDKLIEKAIAAEQTAAAAPQSPPTARPLEREYRDDRYREDDRRHHDSHYYRKKKSFWSDIFD